MDFVTVGDIETNCWLYPLEDIPDSSGRLPCAVIDPGDEAGVIASRLRELKWIPRYIFLTHGHFDHLAALPDLLEFFAEDFPGSGRFPKIGIHRLDRHYLGKDALPVHRESFLAAGGNPAYVDALWKPLPDAGILFEEGDKAGPFTVLHLPGHSSGSAGFYDEKAGILFGGDTLFRGAFGRTDLPGGNLNLLRESLERLLSMRGEIKVCPGHGETTTIAGEAGILTRLF